MGIEIFHCWWNNMVRSISFCLNSSEAIIETGSSNDIVRLIMVAAFVWFELWINMPTLEPWDGQPTMSIARIELIPQSRRWFPRRLQLSIATLDRQSVNAGEMPLRFYNYHWSFMFRRKFNVATELSQSGWWQNVDNSVADVVVDKDPSCR